MFKELNLKENRQGRTQKKHRRGDDAVSVPLCKNVKAILLVYLELCDAFLDEAYNLVCCCKAGIGVCFCCLSTHLLRC